MRPDARDAGYLWDILEAARLAPSLTEGTTRDEYFVDRKLQLAIERLLENIGEAARQVSPEFAKAHPEIPWRPMIGQRNILAHNYGEIDQARLWGVVSDRLPELVDRLMPLVPPPPS